MAYTTSHVQGAGIVDRLVALKNDYAVYRAKRRVFRTTFEELNALSNRELADLGMSRSEIKRVAYEAAYDK